MHRQTVWRQDKSRAKGRGSEREYRLSSLYRQAQQCIADRDWDGALANLEQISLIEPDYQDTAGLAAQVWHKTRLHQAYRQGAECLDRRDLEGALGYLTWVVNQSPDYPDARAKLRQAQQQVRLVELYRQGLNHYSQGRWSEAIETFDKAFALPRSA